MQVLHDDIYKYVKSDTLKGLNWICGDEAAFGLLGCNGGEKFRVVCSRPPQHHKTVSLQRYELDRAVVRYPMC